MINLILKPPEIQSLVAIFQSIITKLGLPNNDRIKSSDDNLYFNTTTHLTHVDSETNFIFR